MDEADFIAALRAVAVDPAARGLADDVAVIGDLVFSHDMIVEGVHYLASDPPESVAWKLIAVNLSDLAAKGAEPVAALMGYCLTNDDDWDSAFVEGLGIASRHFGVPIIGGDTVRLPPGTARMLGLTVIGRATGLTPSRSGAGVGDTLFVTGNIGDAGLGLSIAREGAGDAVLLAAYQRPVPQLAAGRALAGVVTAMMDVSDGLLIDASRMAVASGVGVRIDLDAVPLSRPYIDTAGATRAARLAAAVSGDDYQLLFTSPHPLPTLPLRVTRIGQVVRGSGISIYDSEGAVPAPNVLGWQH
ncbi:MAG: thiamine-phosphate kinase [Sphingomonadaceae bacterium]